jgi:hypothetical protein
MGGPASDAAPPPQPEPGQPECIMIMSAAPAPPGRALTRPSVAEPRARPGAGARAPTRSPGRAERLFPGRPADCSTAVPAACQRRPAPRGAAAGPVRPGHGPAGPAGPAGGPAGHGEGCRAGARAHGRSRAETQEKRERKPPRYSSSSPCTIYASVSVVSIYSILCALPKFFRRPLRTPRPVRSWDSIAGGALVAARFPPAIGARPVGPTRRPITVVPRKGSPPARGTAQERPSAVRGRVERRGHHRRPEGGGAAVPHHACENSAARLRPATAPRTTQPSTGRR